MNVSTAVNSVPTNAMELEIPQGTKRKRDGDDFQSSKRAKPLSVEENIHALAYGNDNVITIVSALKRLIPSISINPEVKKDLEVIKAKLKFSRLISDRVEGLDEVILDLKRLTKSNQIGSIYEKIFPSAKRDIHALLGSGALKLELNTIHFTKELADVLDDQGLEEILSALDPQHLQFIKKLTPEFSSLPLLGPRTMKILATKCPFMDISLHIDLPERMCNQTLLVDGTRFRVNKEVLMKLSPFFKAMWEGSMKEASKIETDLNEVESQTVVQFFDLFKMSIDHWYNKYLTSIDINQIVSLLEFLDRCEMLNKSMIDRVRNIVYNYIFTKRHEIVAMESNAFIKHLFSGLQPYFTRYNFGNNSKTLLKEIVVKQAQNHPLDDLQSKIENQKFIIQLEDAKNGDSFSSLAKLLQQNKQIEEAIQALKKAEACYKNNEQSNFFIMEQPRLTPYKLAQGRAGIYSQLEKLYSDIGNHPLELLYAGKKLQELNFVGNNLDGSFGGVFRFPLFGM